jgi:pimeloyl-ACP methyl ester carboxylesterase
LENWGHYNLGLMDWVLRAVRLSTPFVRSYRKSLSDLSALAIGDVLLYQSRGQEIRDFIRAKIESKDTKPPVTLVAHSLGGIACVDLLAMPNPPKVKKIITAGSQSPFLHELGALASLRPGEPLPDGFPPWLNFYDRNDFLSYIAKPFWPEVIDHEVRSGQPFPDSHGAYFGSEDVWTKIREFTR